MSNPDFDAALDWIQSRLGKQIYFEAGIDDPTRDHNFFHPVSLHVTPTELLLGEDVDHEARGIAVVTLDGPSGRDRLYLDPVRVTNIVLNHAGLRITFHDSITLGFSGG
jgi:hypothetical protein